MATAQIVLVPFQCKAVETFLTKYPGLTPRRVSLLLAMTSTLQAEQGANVDRLREFFKYLLNNFKDAGCDPLSTYHYHKIGNDFTWTRLDDEAHNTLIQGHEGRPKVLHGYVGNRLFIFTVKRPNDEFVEVSLPCFEFDQQKVIGTHQTARQASFHELASQGFAWS